MRSLKRKAKRNGKRRRTMLGKHGLAWRSLRRSFGFPRRDQGEQSLHRILGVSRRDLRDILVANQWP